MKKPDHKILWYLEITYNFSKVEKKIREGGVACAFGIMRFILSVGLYPFKNAHQIGLSEQAQFSSIIYVFYQENPATQLLQSM